MKSVPLRVTRTQLFGAVFKAGPATVVVDPETAERDWNVKPLPGVIATSALTAPAPDPSRIMTPALARVLVFDCEVTRARISPSPTSACEANWKACCPSDVRSGSAHRVGPAALRSAPAMPTEPISAPAHPDGRELTTLILSVASAERPPASVTRTVKLFAPTSHLACRRACHWKPHSTTRDRSPCE